jgi:hypothetical protein
MSVPGINTGYSHFIVLVENMVHVNPFKHGIYVNRALGFSKRTPFVLKRQTG